MKLQWKVDHPNNNCTCSIIQSNISVGKQSVLKCVWKL